MKDINKDNRILAMECNKRNTVTAELHSPLVSICHSRVRAAWKSSVSIYQH